LAIGEPSYISFCFQGKIVAAMVVPKNVTAITKVASRVRVRKLRILKAKSMDTIIDGMTINMSALIGVRVRGSTAETHSGSMRSKAAAKITRVELKKTVPDQPNHHKLISKMMMN
jgi:hypothetical protein